MSVTLTPAQIAYLDGQSLGRLATVRPDGSPQNSPVAVTFNKELGTIDIGGYRMGATRKFHNVQTNDRVALVVDDLVSLDPYTPRCLEIRGTAEALTDAEPPRPGMTRDVIRIHPTRIIAFGLDDATS
ncbi:PPOX class F420-dependent oxidoreductase [Nocardia sp. NPDC052566]|uniref:PPOX class F420-dependent oxidoreductase n=1 Tax=Nocardia sp. NPDC052566 TaxID=3364330 RepID=UPI0037C963A7